MLHIYGVVGKTAQLKVVNSGQTTSRLSPIRLDCVLPDERDCHLRANEQNGMGQKGMITKISRMRFFNRKYHYQPFMNGR